MRRAKRRQRETEEDHRRLIGSPLYSVLPQKAAATLVGRSCARRVWVRKVRADACAGSGVYDPKNQKTGQVLVRTADHKKVSDSNYLSPLCPEF